MSAERVTAPSSGYVARTPRLWLVETIEADWPAAVVVIERAQRHRQRTIDVLMPAVAQMMVDVDPEGHRDTRSLWELGPKERGRRFDLFDRIRLASDQLVVLGTQMAYWRAPLAPKASPSPADMVSALNIFARLLDREEEPLRELEHDAPALRFECSRYPGLRFKAIGEAVSALRHEHVKAICALELLEQPPG